ncbi:MAG: hypothetical protein ACRD43_00040 [Pyrinomonadaceae bacterium]
MKRDSLSSRFLSIFTFIVVACVVGCSVEASKRGDDKPDAATVEIRPDSAPNSLKGATIKIEQGGPADTVRAFYSKLRDKKFREAIYLTNLRPAIEGLSDKELKDFDVDFEALSQQIPEQIEINGEIITGDQATVTASLPGDDPDKLELQKIELKKENGVWIILTVDADAEKKIKEEGKSYFYNLRIATHHEEAKTMLDRVSKAEIAFSTQHQGLFGEIKALIESGFLPPDIESSVSTGYNYSLSLSPDKKRYTASATPAEYGKTGKLSFWVDLDEKGMPHLDSKDNGGKPMKN